MARPIEIGVASETKAFKQGVDVGIIAPLEDAVEALDDLGKSRGPEQLESGLRDAQDASEKLQKETKDTAQTIEREYRDAYRSMKNASKDGNDAAREGLKDFKEESAGVARETAASFDGSAQSIIDSFQEIAANSFVGFGPAGAAAGIAAAAGIGLAGAAMAENTRRAEVMRDETVAAFDDMIEAGGNFYTKDIENARIRDALLDEEKYKNILAITKLTGISEADVARAVALAGTERNKIIDQLKEQARINESISQNDAEAYALGQLANRSIEDQVTLLEDLNKAQGTAVNLATTYDQATGGTLAKRAEDHELVLKRNRALADTPKTVNTKLTVDTSELDRVLSVKRSVDLVIKVLDEYGRKIK